MGLRSASLLRPRLCPFRSWIKSARALGKKKWRQSALWSQCSIRALLVSANVILSPEAPWPPCVPRFSSDQHSSGLLLTFASLMSPHGEAPDQTSRSEVHYLVALCLVLNLIRLSGFCAEHRVQRLISRFKSISSSKQEVIKAALRSEAGRGIWLACAEHLLEIIERDRMSLAITR